MIISPHVSVHLTEDLIDAQSLILALQSGIEWIHDGGEFYPVEGSLEVKRDDCICTIGAAIDNMITQGVAAAAVAVMSQYV